MSIRKRPATMNNQLKDKLTKLKNNLSRAGFVPYFIIGISIIICLLAVWMQSLSNDRGVNSSNRSARDSKSKVELELNQSGYSNKSVDMPTSEKYSEYYYMPDEGENAYAYNIKIYHSGVGVVTIFPLESMGKAFNQVYSFYVEEDDLQAVVEDTEKYRFQDLSTEKSGEKVNYYLYYYDGTSSEGAGGYITPSALYKKIAAHIEACVPDAVWTAIEAEILRYYE